MAVFVAGVPCYGVLVRERVNFRSTIGGSGKVITPNGTVTVPADDFPPDTNGAVGPNHIVEINKKEMRFYNKSGQLGFATSLDGFWNSVLPSPVDGVERGPGQNKSFDPRILYDEGMDRWIAVSVSSEHRFDQNNKLLVAVSNTPDPQGTWTANAFTSDPLTAGINAPLSQRYWADFPRLGIDEEGITVATTLFDLDQDQNSGLQNIYTFSKDAIINNNAIQVMSSSFHLNDTQAPDFAQPVVEIHSNGLLAAVPNLPGGLVPVKPVGHTLIGLGPQGVPQRVDIVNGVPEPLESISPSLVGAYQANVPSKGLTPSNPIPVNVGPHPQAVIEGSVIFKNGYYWAVRDKYDNSTNDSNVIEWMRIDPVTNQVVSGLIKDNNPNDSARQHYYYPSIAVNDKGYIFIGFNGSSGEDYIGAYGVAGETVNGNVSFGGVFTIKEGERPYERLDSQGRNRWGDYSATVVDPANDNVFWTFQEYAQASFADLSPNTYATRIAAYEVSPLLNAAISKTYTRIGLKRSTALDEAAFDFAKEVHLVDIGGKTYEVNGQSFRLPLDGADGSFDLSFQGDAQNYLVNAQGFLGGAGVPDALAGWGVPPVLTFDPSTGEAFAEFFNPYDFFLNVDNVQLFINNELRNLNLLDFATPTGDLVSGVPTSFILWPDQTFRLSFGILPFNTDTYLLALAEFSRLDDPDVKYSVAAAGVFTAPVPEPVTAALGLMGFAALCTATRRRAM